ncbi:hypothetical protein [Clostridium tarantellae]|uniref:Uncharacterized protein n=1 Tax=Clostridium tarantellae TaxID=39493 RepID=A0A6I1MNT4_9CLOT|nr:hypothetical protein [Clostridium tarantellae]MPQ45075.1 hypothetical protein [Clostridium tarantellae]
MKTKNICTAIIIGVQLLGTILLILSIFISNMKILGNIGVGIMGLANITFGYVMSKNTSIKQGWLLIVSGIILVIVSITTLILR